MGVKFVAVPASVKLLGEECFSRCRSLFSVAFESGSKLSGIKSNAFSYTGLTDMIVPASLEILSEEFFSF
jgi:hypothetical protein